MCSLHLANQGMPCLLGHSDWPEESTCDPRRPIRMLPWPSIRGSCQAPSREAWLLGKEMRPQSPRDDSWRERESLDGTEVPMPASSSVRVLPSPLSSVS